MISLTLGYDPGPREPDCTVMPWDGTAVPQVGFAEFGLCTEAVVIEIPVAQGAQIIKKQPLIDTAFQAGRIAAFWLYHPMTNNPPIYLVPRAVIMQQLGYSTKDGNGDAWLRRYFETTHKFKCGRGTILNSTHARAALACAMWHWRDPRNQQHRFTP